MSRIESENTCQDPRINVFRQVEKDDARKWRARRLELTGLELEIEMNSRDALL